MVPFLLLVAMTEKATCGLVAMANSVDRDEYREVFDVRPGLKREFAFALESTTQHASPGCDKRTRSCYVMNNEEEGWNLEMSGSGNSTLKKIPRKLKELLETGLLEGTPVHYQYGPKAKGKSGLKGIVCGTGITCSCPDCHGTKVISPNEFEKHAHSRNKRPADYIYLENGNNLRAVLNACTNATLEALESIIQGMIGCTSSSAEQNVFCPICTSSISGKEMLYSSCKEISTQCALCRGHDFSTSDHEDKIETVADGDAPDKANDPPLEKPKKKPMRKRAAKKKCRDTDEDNFPIIDFNSLEDHVPDRKEKPHDIITNKNENAITKKLPDDIFYKIQEIHNANGPSAALYTKLSTSNKDFFITLNDLYNFIDGESLCNNLINGYTHILKQEYKAKSTKTFKILNSILWFLLKDRQRYENLLDTKITDSLRKHIENKYKLLFFPINSNRNQPILEKADHWTLLVLNVEQKKWSFYNSNIPLVNINRPDPYLVDAKLVMGFVQEKLKMIADKPSFSIDSQDGYTLEVVKDCPYQGATSDCALYVCYNIETIINDEPVTRETSSDKILEFKAKMITRIVNRYNQS